MPHIFISYAKKDTRRLAESLQRELAALPGVTAWMDTSLEAGESWAYQIQQEIDRSDYVVVLLSPDVNRPPTAKQGLSFVLKEITYAQQKNKIVVPVKVQETDLPVQISDIQYVDLTANPGDPALIVEQVRKRFAIGDHSEVSDTAVPPPPPPRLLIRVAVTLALVILVTTLAVLVRSALISPDPTPTPPTPTERWTPAVNAALEAARTFTGSNADWQALYPEGFVHAFDDGVPMALVPAGCFMMGSDDGRSDEQPAHEQCFDAPFWLDLTEVTQADFARLDGSNTYGPCLGGEQHPHECIIWFEARDFCALRGARLPTEREWEYAARGPSAWLYPWGDEWNPEYAVWGRSSEQGSANVGSIPAGRSWVGAYDMSGNVSEWVNTLYGIDINGDFDFSDEGERRYDYPYSGEDGRELDSNERTYSRVLRGGSLSDSSASGLRATSRVRQLPNDPNIDIGFRCARSS